ncbi:MFS transporter [Streptomyces tagetis]|uniref:Putative proline/betaine transporter n=1 Tax=Streptomyces tagetis TaxID=2820809 RepID=A0A940XKA1_9ACTN|nr:MFS transporter [Streptomyces sp. RG38]MBQ0826190.1 MHS family MFS transporter [Streptomyces sp. RG38]
MSHTPPSASARSSRRATTAAFVGTAIEWYDFYIFGTAAALVFGKVFYPDIAPGAGVLASFATMWVGFLARPLGGIVFGHMGDRVGRKNTLVITLVMMGVATFCIGLLPTYGQIGFAAPALLVLLRAVQGLAVGGEWGGAVLMATENASEKKKGSAGMWVQQGSPAGSILATLMFLLVGTLPDQAFLTWGWRVPFLLSALLVVVGLVIRLKVEESADFERAKERDDVVKMPLMEVLRTAPGVVALGMGASIMGIAAAYFNNTFVLSWTTTELGVGRQTMLNILLVIAVLQFLLQPLAARLSQRFGAVRVMAGGLTLSVLIVVPMFLLISTANPLLITVGLILPTLGTVLYYAMLSSFLASVFPANVRYTGVSLAYQLCSSLIGGATPLIAQTVLINTGVAGIGIFYGVMLVVTLACVLGLARLAAKRAAVSGSAGSGTRVPETV